MSVYNIKKPATSVQVSSSSGTFSLTGITDTQITNFSVTISTNGRPVMIMVNGDGTGGATINRSYIGLDKITTTGPVSAWFQLKRGGTKIAEYELQLDANAESDILRVPSSVLSFIDENASVGSNTYTITVRAGSATETVQVYYSVMKVFEL